MKAKILKFLCSILVIGCGFVQISGCKKLIEIDLPIDKLTAKAVFNSTGGASAALSNIYYLLFTINTSHIKGLLADELILTNENSTFLNSMYTNSLSSSDGELNEYWKKYYDLIFRINSIIEGVGESTGISVSSKNELIGQAKFLRAYVYLELVNLYGGVPLVTSTDYKVNTRLPRSSEADIYQAIVTDLLEAQSLVNVNYLKTDLQTQSSERVTANKAVVTALLARVYLYTGRWVEAEAESTKVINDARYVVLNSLSEVFLKNSMEAIWQVEGDVNKGTNSEGVFFIPTELGEIPSIYLSNNLLKLIPSNDSRHVDWLNKITIGSDNYYFPFKYKQDKNSNITTEYKMMLRLGEQYLIRAEARANQNNLNGSIEDLNVIRNRAKLSPYTTLDHQSLNNAIEQERQVELFSEQGHRWFDLKRTNRTDVILGPIKGINWQSTDILFPIPAEEFTLNPGLRGHQNPGYSEN